MKKAHRSAQADSPTKTIQPPKDYKFKVGQPVLFAGSMRCRIVEIKPEDPQGLNYLLRCLQVDWFPDKWATREQIEPVKDSKNA